MNMKKKAKHLATKGVLCLLAILTVFSMFGIPNVEENSSLTANAAATGYNINVSFDENGHGAGQVIDMTTEMAVGKTAKSGTAMSLQILYLATESGAASICTALDVVDANGNSVSDLSVGKTVTGAYRTASFTMPESDVTVKATMELLGDVNLNGVINGIDLALVKKYNAGTVTLSDSAKIVANVSGMSSTEINGIDLSNIKKFNAGTATTFPNAIIEQPLEEPIDVPADEDIVVATKQTATFSTTATSSTSGNTATVSTDEGLNYTATGYSACNNGAFTINDGFTVTFDEGAYSDEFNRFALYYVSDQPLEGTITYTENGEEKNDSFFLEAGTDSFYCLTTNYLSGTTGTDVEKITFSTCEDVNATFKLCDVLTEKYTVYSDDTYYIKNNRFKLGVRLLWGGGINYIEDVRTPVEGLTNLVNQADTGRLIQQSYYGTIGNDEYTSGFFNNSPWVFNPVQGGDQYGNHSRIIDVVVTDFSVYIKSQPQDWSLDGQITPTYMENSYTLYSDYIRTDNRFVDFSGWEHHYTDQELPAFYTVSYLDRFTWYDGFSGWTDDTLSYRDDLQFWGDPAYSSDCIIPIRKSNTETWCSWTNSNVDYGIGLYVPNVDRWFAGKFSYNASKDPANGACNYVAPINVMKMVSYDAIEYSYLITTGSVNEIRNTFGENKDFADNASLHENYTSVRIEDAVSEPFTIDFTTEANASLITALNNTKVAYEKAKTAVKLTATSADDVQAYIDFTQFGQLYAQNYKTMTIEYMVPKKNKNTDYSFEMFLCAGNVTIPTGGMSVTGSYVKGDSWNTVTVSLEDLSFWTGRINCFRFDYMNVCQANDSVLIRSITLSP